MVNEGIDTNSWAQNVWSFANNFHINSICMFSTFWAVFFRLSTLYMLFFAIACIRFVAIRGKKSTINSATLFKWGKTDLFDEIWGSENAINENGRNGVHKTNIVIFLFGIHEYLWDQSCCFFSAVCFFPSLSVIKLSSW